MLSDLAYAEVYFDDSPPPSLLQVPGAIDIARIYVDVENFLDAGMAEWFAVGNERIIAALGRVKSYLDYGAFTPVQVAATAALNGRMITSRTCAKSTDAGEMFSGKFQACGLACAGAPHADVCLGADPRAFPELGER